VGQRVLGAREGPCRLRLLGARPVQLGFFRGSALKDPSGLLRGEGKFVRHIKVRKRSDIDERRFWTLLRQAFTGAAVV
jgi:hypothetical protein